MKFLHSSFHFATHCFHPWSSPVLFYVCYHTFYHIHNIQISTSEISQIEMEFSHQISSEWEGGIVVKVKEYKKRVWTGWKNERLCLLLYNENYIRKAKLNHFLPVLWCLGRKRLDSILFDVMGGGGSISSSKYSWRGLKWRWRG